MNTQNLVMKINPDEKTPFRNKIDPGCEVYGCGRLIHDFAAYELSGCEEGVELKSIRWMQEQTDGPLNLIQTLKALEGWRMRMRREFLKWGKKDAPDCWDYIPVNLRIWSDWSNPSEKWTKIPVLFLWRCHLWQSRLRGCEEKPIHPREPGNRRSLWERSYGWLYSTMDNKIVWNPKKAVSFKKLPPDVAEYLSKDWLLRLEDPSVPPIWDENFKGLCQMDQDYIFETWTGSENWIPKEYAKDRDILTKWKGGE